MRKKIIGVLLGFLLVSQSFMYIGNSMMYVMLLIISMSCISLTVSSFKNQMNS